MNETSHRKDVKHMGLAARRVRLILLSMALGLGVGLFVGSYPAASPVIGVLELFGRIFLNLLRLLTVPIVMASVITAVATLGSLGVLRRLALNTLLFYVVTTLFAIVTAISIANVFHPGVIAGTPVRDLLGFTTDSSSVEANLTSHASSGVLGVLNDIVPSNIVEAAAGTRILDVVFFSAIFGFFLSRIEEPYRAAVMCFWQGVLRVMMRMTEWFMRSAPIGVFSLTAVAAMKSGIRSAGPLLTFAGCVVLGLAIYSCIVLPIVIRMLGKVSPWAVFSAMSPAVLTAFSTASTSAALPISLECIQKRAGVSERTATFVIPLGTAANHSGSALYECLAAFFVAQAYGVSLSLATQLTLVTVTLIASMGIASIPAASLIGLTVVLNAVGLPPEALGSLLVVDRILDMARTAVNVLSNAACAVIVARREGEPALLRAPPVKNSS